MFNNEKIKSLFGKFLDDDTPIEEIQELDKSVESEKKEPISLTDTNNQPFNLENFLAQDPRAKMLFNSLFTLKQKEYYYSRKLNKFEYVKSRNDLMDLISLDFPEFVGVYEKGAKRGKRYSKLDSLFFSSCFFVNKIEIIISQVNLFQEEKLLIEKTGSVLFIKRNYLNFIEPKPLDIDEVIHNQIIDDYHKHFKELTDILEWIVACRFTDNRRQSYLHLQLPAGFGKSFFKGLLKAMGMSTECRYEDFKSPTSLNAQEFQCKFHSHVSTRFTLMFPPIS